MWEAKAKMNTTSNYWTHVAGARYSRRRALRAAAIGGLGAAAASVLSCGGNDSETGNTEPKDASGLLAKIEDTSSQARRGGTYLGYVASEHRSLSPLAQTSHLTNGTLLLDSHQRLVRQKVGRFKQESLSETEGDAAESWELLDGGLRFTLKLRPNNGFDPRPPTEGRVLNAQDVAFSFEKFARISGYRQNLAHSASPDGPVESVTAIDSRTVSMKLAKPDADLLTVLRFLFVEPVESDGKYDSGNLIRGSGPWMMTDHKPSAYAVYEKNPGAFDKDSFFIDKLELPIISEYATGLAQFRAGHVFTYPVMQADILQTKEDLPQLAMYYNDTISTANNFAFFGWQDNAPFRDQRVRQAMRMAIDDEAILAVLFDIDKVRGRGLPIELFYNSSCFTAGHAGMWMNPKSKEFGPNAKYLEYNPAEAKKLLTAAGYPNGFETTEYSSTTSPTTRNGQAALGMYADIGIRAKQEQLPLADWQRGMFDARGKWKGLTFWNRSLPQGTLELFIQYTRTGSRYFGFDVNGRDPENGDPGLEDMIRRQKVELDAQKRKDLLDDIQRYLAEKLYYPMITPAWATSFSLAWPKVMNATTFKDAKPYQHQWLDPARPPA